MPRIFQMADDFAERFAFEPSRVSGIVKALRDDRGPAGDCEPLIKAGARGVNAPDATPLDAARILIAMMLRVKHHEAPEGVRLFGKFPLYREALDNPNQPAPETFEEALAGLLALYADPNMDGASVAYSVAIDRDHAAGIVTKETFSEDESDEDESADKVKFRYLHEEYQASLANDGQPTPALLAAWRAYRTGFHEVPELSTRDLIEIGQVLAGNREPLRCVE